MALQYVAPSPQLAVELNEVRADAAALAETFGQLNAQLPEDFPSSAVMELTAALLELPHGTARGCLRPLNEAQAQLAAIRSEHIRHDDLGNTMWDVDRQPLFRGEPIDQRLRSLMSSVSTALQTANRLAAEELEPESPELEVEPLKDSSTAELAQKTAEAERELRDEKNELSDLRLNSEFADTLGRRLTDAVVLNGLSRGELRLPRIVPARLRRISATLREYPELLQKAAELVVTGVNATEYAYDKWHHLKERIFKSATTTVREIAEDIGNYARRLDNRRREIETKQDFNLEEATKLIHRGVAPPVDWQPLITDLPLGNRRLKSLAPLAGLVNLRAFEKPSVRVSDLTPLKNLTSLRRLDLSGTAATNLGALSRLENLDFLNLNFVPVDDLGPIGNLKKLIYLYLDSSQIDDIGAISTLENLLFLDLDNTPIEDLRPLAGLKNLRHLRISGTRVADLSPLAEVANLRDVSFANTDVMDLSALSAISGLARIHCSGTKISDLSPLAKLQHLIQLTCDRTSVSDVSPLVSCSELSFLSIDNTKVSDLSPLIDCHKLQTLSIHELKVDIPAQLKKKTVLR